MSRWCNRALVHSTFHYALCVRERDFAAELARLKINSRDTPQFLSTDHADATTHFFDLREGGRVVSQSAIVCLRWPAKGKTGTQYAGLLVHEAVHIWQHIIDDLGERAPSSEFEAYSIQTLAQELMEQFVRQTKRSR